MSQLDEEIAQTLEVLSALDKGRVTKKELDEVIEALMTVISSFITTTKEEKAVFMDRIERTVRDRLSQVKDGKDGHTPTKEEMLALIKPLIPEVRNGEDGKDADPNEVAEIVLSRIPSPYTAEIIRDMLEGLQEDEKLTIEAIKGLREELDEIRKTKKGFTSGGSLFGGISHTPTHETFTMNGSDTTVTLSQGVSAQGNAIIALRYQGQVLDMTTHYTVNGNKITFVGFTPENGTIISVTYIP